LRRLPLRENADLDIPIPKEANAEYAKLTFSLGADLLDAAVNLGQRQAQVALIKRFALWS
jgi:hypothetical protein